VARDETLSAELLQHPVHVHGGQSHRIPEFLLGERQLEGVVARQADSLGAKQHLADEMSQPLVGRAVPDRDQPLA
jgi:hypothetical protein